MNYVVKIVFFIKMLCQYGSVNNLTDLHKASGRKHCAPTKPFPVSYLPTGKSIRLLTELYWMLCITSLNVADLLKNSCKQSSQT